MQPRGRPIGWQLLGFAGSSLLAVGALGAGVLPKPDPLRDAVVLSAMRAGPGRVICIALAAGGMAALVVAWLGLGRLLDGCDLRRLYLTAALWGAPLALAPPILSRDVYAYAVAGQMMATGLNPYQHGAGDLVSPWVTSTSTSWLHVPFAYGPLFLMLTRAVVAGAGGSLLAVVLGMRLLAVAGTVLLGWALPRAARACGVDERRAVWLGLVNPLVLAHFVGGAHADALMVGLLVAGLAVAAGRWPAAGALLCTLAVAVKATAAVALPFVALLWLLHRRWSLVRAVAATVGVAAVTFVGVTALSGLGYGWVSTVSTVGLSRQWTSLPTGLGLVVAAASPVSTDTALGVTRAAALALTAATLVWLWLRVLRHPEPRTVLLHCGLALGVVVVLGPAVHPWYLSWPLAVLAAAGIAGTAGRAVVAASAALCFLVMPDGYNLALATKPVGLALDVAVTAALIGWAVRRRTRTRSQNPDRVPA